jgi:hypothetical protein
MKHTSVLHQAERWTKNAARSVWKQVTYDNALKALAVASAVPVLGAAAGAVRAGVAAGSATQVIGGLVSGLSAASAVAPQLAPAAGVASRGAGVASAAAGGISRSQARRQAQGPMTAQAYLNDYGIRRASPAYGTRSQYETALAMGA